MDLALWRLLLHEMLDRLAAALPNSPSHIGSGKKTCATRNRFCVLLTKLLHRLKNAFGVRHKRIRERFILRHTLDSRDSRSNRQGQHSDGSPEYCSNTFTPFLTKLHWNTSFRALLCTHRSG